MCSSDLGGAWTQTATATVAPDGTFLARWRTDVPDNLTVVGVPARIRYDTTIYFDHPGWGDRDSIDRGTRVDIQGCGRNKGGSVYCFVNVRHGDDDYVRSDALGFDRGYRWDHYWGPNFYFGPGGWGGWGGWGGPGMHHGPGACMKVPGGPGFCVNP